MSLLPFSSNLGEHITSSNVSGAHRFKYFTNAIALPFQPKLSPKRELKEANFVDPEEKSFVDSGCQTEDFVYVMSQEEQETRQRLLQEKEIKKTIQFEREERERERNKQEAELPPMTDEEGVNAYRHFLEENEMKDFYLREKELDDAIQRKLLRIQEDLKKRYSEDLVDDHKQQNNRMARHSSRKGDALIRKKDDKLAQEAKDKRKTSQHEPGCERGLSQYKLKDFSVERNEARRNRRVSYNAEHNRKFEDHVRCLNIVESSFVDVT